ncbi:peptidylprolyl isomerase [Flavobacterium sp.]|uniref:peptidylprolyl isomerase n=1 Tax=Flavobacterium sp. TaxID=239 RepID=UPI0011F89FA2|nr:peptidylprolyl isomerase [Flavobacterium sp.]RZJ69782.1 MAG: peptidylprolyl isomerase [Flavobacterium sp.]
MKLKAMLFLCLSIATMQAQNKPAPVKPTAKKAAATKTASSDEGIFAEIETNKGKILLQLEFQKTPITVANFVSLAEGNNPMVAEKYKGKKFYDGLKFHRVIPDFMIQGGDPLGNGSGDPGYKFKDEIVSDLKHVGPGILSMANSGPETNGSQFFITHKETPWLNGKHTVFGHVVSGQNVVNAIAQEDVIQKVTIIRKGKEAKKFDAAKIFGSYFAEKDAAKIKKKAFLDGLRNTATTSETGLQYKIIKNGTGVKPADGTEVGVSYAGYLEDGSLFDTNFEAIAREYGKYDATRASQKGYDPFPFTAGSKSGLIPGFIEALEKMGFGDRLIAFIPAKLGYGERGAGGVIPPNANIIFEIEMTEKKQ